MLNSSVWSVLRERTGRQRNAVAFRSTGDGQDPSVWLHA